MDFGIAAVAGAPALTATGEVVGTLAYMAPEQAEGEHAGPEADVYSLALTLYEAWAGENPVARRTPAQTARQIGQPLPSLGLLRPDLPASLVAQIDASLGSDPRNRPTLKRLRSELDRVSASARRRVRRSLARRHGLAASPPLVRPRPRPGRRGHGSRGPGRAGRAARTRSRPGERPPASRRPGQQAGLALLPLAAVPLGAAGAIAAAPALVAFLGSHRARARGSGSALLRRRT